MLLGYVASGLCDAEVGSDLHSLYEGCKKERAMRSSALSV